MSFVDVFWQDQFMDDVIFLVLLYLFIISFWTSSMVGNVGLSL